METKTLNYVHGGESFAITLRPFVPDFYDKAVAVRADDKTWFTPRVASDSSLASHIPTNDNGNTRALSTNPDIICNSNRETIATACTLVTDQYDFGRLNPDGTQYFQNMASVKATQANSTIYGNSKANHVITVGGDENFFAGSFGLDTYCLHNSSALIVDFGCTTVTKHGDGSLLATSISDETYNRFDTGSYQNQVGRLYIYGSITGVYFDNISSIANQQNAVFDIAVTYTDENGVAQVVLLPAVRKDTIKTSDNISSRTWKSNLVSARVADFYHYSDGEPVLISVDDFKHEWADFPAELVAKLVRLYDIYDQSDFYCSAVDEEAVHQNVPAWTRIPSRVDNQPIDMLAEGRTLNDIKIIFQAGLGKKYFRAGDFFDITFPNEITLDTGSIAADSTWRVVCLGIDHNAELEGYNRGHFCIGRNTDNVDIAFFGKRMNATSTNAGGWGGSALRTWLNSTFYDALPSELKAVISPSTKYTDNVGGTDNLPENVTATVDNIWLWAFVEMRRNDSDHTTGNPAEWDVTARYDYFKQGNSINRYRHDDAQTQARFWTRSVRVKQTGTFRCWTTHAGILNAGSAGAFVPCFTIGG